MVRGKLRKPRALLNPGSWNRPRHLAAEGINLSQVVRALESDLRFGNRICEHKSCPPIQGKCGLGRNDHANIRGSPWATAILICLGRGCRFPAIQGWPLMG